MTGVNRRKQSSAKFDGGQTPCEGLGSLLLDKISCKINGFGVFGFASAAITL